MNRPIATRRTGLLLFLLLASGCRSAAPTEVVVLGMIHGDHRTSAAYGLDRVRAAIRRIDPDAVLCEIPPDRLAAARSEFEATGTITEPRVRVFPEYTDVLFPLTREMDFTIVPCAAWTRAMADDRRATLVAWRETRAADTAEVERAQDLAEQAIAAGGGDDPLFIHTGVYDFHVRLALEPYDRLFNDDLGAGGWTTINAAHFALIARALDERRGRGERVLITFGAWHKYWFLDRLRERDDVVLLDARDFLRAE